MGSRCIQAGPDNPYTVLGIFGIAGAIGYFFLDIYGLEGDLRGGEEDIGRLEENIEEEE